MTAFGSRRVQRRLGAGSEPLAPSLQLLQKDHEPLRALGSSIRTPLVFRRVDHDGQAGLQSVPFSHQCFIARTAREGASGGVPVSRASHRRTPVATAMAALRSAALDRSDGSCPACNSPICAARVSRRRG